MGLVFRAGFCGSRCIGDGDGFGSGGGEREGRGRVGYLLGHSPVGLVG